MKHYGDELQSVISQLLRVRAVSTNSCQTHILLNTASLGGFDNIAVMMTVVLKFCLILHERE